ncbi:UDP-glucose 4-epimerase GalE [Streptomyces tateyamensis]|uniref:UDP-glucose 4-epimerase n=1 Tax=Streptomyces tateyamensis TaxID=565073 RepID=A0A2V4P0N3_9ACTN|nr:UDP-glucose 4-epimerase GalE [Streptomyces tateyamensis]PYC77710.1 UDP-glucose 4-epimerase GalE [Streptomyces tateyamensis]
MKVLITGGAGFIGSTVATACLDHGITPVLLDDLATGAAEFTEGRIFYRGDIADGPLLDRIFAEYPEIEAAVHCAALIVVPESVAEPLAYYRVNVAKTAELAGHLLRNGCEQLVFSSSAAVYAAPAGGTLVVDEEAATAPSSPYARTKLMAEQLLRDTAAATPLRVIALRYFNPIGADPQLRTGLRNPTPTHALGQLIQAHEQGRAFELTGGDWPTRDGSGIRDYVHVWDLALAHVAALRRFAQVLPAGRGGFEAVNLGTGTGTTVRELHRAFEQVVGVPVPLREGASRPGDVAGCYPSVDKARRLLGWAPGLTLADGIRDSLSRRARRLNP